MKSTQYSRPTRPTLNHPCAGMTIVEYLDSIKERLLTDQIIDSFRIIREITTSIDGYMRARLAFLDGSQVEFSMNIFVVLDEIANMS